MTDFDGASSKTDRTDFITGQDTANIKRLMTSVNQLKNRDKNYKNIAFFMHNDFQDWIDKNTKGNRLILLNEIIKRGILAIEAKGQHIEVFGDEFDGLGRK